MTNNILLQCALKEFYENGITCYFVGGCVRDQILGIPTDDIDICLVGVTDRTLVTEILAKYANSVAAEKGANFPVWIADFGGDKIDFALAREEEFKGVTRQNFSIQFKGVTIGQDLLRRDLTVNAMAINCHTGEFVDPYGGRNDLEALIARPVSAAFADDPLRVVRAARFMVKLNLEAKEQLILTCWFLRPVGISNERIGMELKKVLYYEVSTTSTFFKFLKQVDWLNTYFGQINNDLFEARMKAIDKLNLSPLEKATLLCYGLSPKEVEKMLGGISLLDGNFRKQISCLLKNAKVLGKADFDRSTACKVLRDLDQHGLSLDTLYNVIERINVCFDDGYCPRHHKIFIEIQNTGYSVIVTGDMLIELGYSQGKELGQKMAQLLELQDQGILHASTWQYYFILL